MRRRFRGRWYEVPGTSPPPPPPKTQGTSQTVSMEKLRGSQVEGESERLLELWRGEGVGSRKLLINANH